MTLSALMRDASSECSVIYSPKLCLTPSKAPLRIKLSPVLPVVPAALVQAKVESLPLIYASFSRKSVFESLCTWRSFTLKLPWSSSFSSASSKSNAITFDGEWFYIPAPNSSSPSFTCLSTFDFSTFFQDFLPESQLGCFDTPVCTGFTTILAAKDLVVLITICSVLVPSERTFFFPFVGEFIPIVSLDFKLFLLKLSRGCDLCFLLFLDFAATDSFSSYSLLILSTSAIFSS